jgi:predicted RNA binding protein YcfA (HicA-like mRNA interferase family)
LEAAGFAEVSRKGSHVKFVRRTGQIARTAIVPEHREVALGTLRSILRQAGLTPDDFEAL